MRREQRAEQARRAGLANGTKFRAGDPRTRAASLKGAANGGFKEGDPKVAAYARIGGLKAAAMRASKPGTPDYRNAELILLRGFAALQRSRVRWAYRNTRTLRMGRKFGVEITIRLHYGSEEHNNQGVPCAAKTTTPSIGRRRSSPVPRPAATGLCGAT